VFFPPHGWFGATVVEVLDSTRRMCKYGNGEKMEKMVEEIDVIISEPTAEPTALWSLRRVKSGS
jgi:hypothetical protein